MDKEDFGQTHPEGAVTEKRVPERRKPSGMLLIAIALVCVLAGQEIWSMADRDYLDMVSQSLSGRGVQITYLDNPSLSTIQTGKEIAHLTRTMSAETLYHFRGKEEPDWQFELIVSNRYGAVDEEPFPSGATLITVLVAPDALKIDGENYTVETDFVPLIIDTVTYSGLRWYIPSRATGQAARHGKVCHRQQNPREQHMLLPRVLLKIRAAALRRRHSSSLSGGVMERGPATASS